MESNQILFYRLNDSVFGDISLLQELEKLTVQELAMMVELLMVHDQNGPH